MLFVPSVRPPSLLLTKGFINSVGLFQTYYEQVLLTTHNAFQIGWISSFLICTVNIVVGLMIVELMVGNCNGTALRHLWTSVATHRRNSGNCFGIDDVVHMQRILSILSGSGDSYSNRSIINVPSSFVKN